MFQSFLIKYAEIGLKGKNRYVFEDALMKHIRRSLKELEGTFAVTKESGRITWRPSRSLTTTRWWRLSRECSASPQSACDARGGSGL